MVDGRNVYDGGEFIDMGFEFRGVGKGKN